MSNNNTVYIVHAIDTEGPLYESPEAAFERLEEVFGVSDLPKSPETLEKLRNGEIDIGGKEDAVASMLNSHAANFMNSWPRVDEMLDRLMAEEFRMRLPDSYGGGWIFNWHCVDHVGYENNPRRRTIGYHAIFDHYRERLQRDPQWGDQIHFHFHPMSTYRDAHRCATSFVNSPELYQVMARRIIERHWFPTVFRAGFQAERPDSHLFLEQWIPFDITNMALDDNSSLDAMIDFRNGRSGDWRRAPADWSVYQPHHDDYQVPGQCRRWIGRALNPLSRVGPMTQDEMDKAFARAASGQPALVGLSGHDFRDLETEVDFVRELIASSLERYPDVKFKYSEAVEAFRAVTGCGNGDGQALELELTLNRNPSDDVPNIEIVAAKGKVFGPQPFLAIETMSRRFIHDNLDFALEDGRWSYAFHTDTLPLRDVSRVGVGAADAAGNFSVKVIDVNE